MLSTSGFLHQLQELARIGGQALDIAALAIGVDGVEGERRLAGPGQAGDHHQLVAWQVDVDRSEIMFPSAADTDEVVHEANRPWEAASPMNGDRRVNTARS